MEIDWRYSHLTRSVNVLLMQGGDGEGRGGGGKWMNPVRTRKSSSMNVRDIPPAA